MRDGWRTAMECGHAVAKMVCPNEAFETSGHCFEEGRGMKIFGAMLLGSAVGLTLVGGAQAADLPTRKSAPVEYVRICNVGGMAGFLIPGSNTCLKIGGAVRAEYYYRGNAPTGVANQFAYNLAGQVYSRDAIQFRGRAYLNIDARSTTEYGDLRGFASLRFSDDSLPSGPFGGGKNTVAGLPLGAKANAGSFQGLTNTNFYVDAAYVQWAGITAGVAHSFFDFYVHNYEIGSYTVGTSHQPLDLLAYTAKFNGFSATASVEDPTTRRIGNSVADVTANDVNPTATKAAYLTYGALNAPDVVGNLRYDGSWGSVQVAGALHEVNAMPVNLAGGVLPVGFTPSTVWGGALDAGVKVKLDSISPGDSLTAQVTWDRGAADYTNAWSYWNGTSNVYYKGLSISVPANDAFVLPNGSIGLSQATGGFLGYQHYWVPTVRSALFGSYLSIRNPTAAQRLTAGADNAVVWDIGFNTFWSPVKQLDIGAEVVYTNLQLSGAQNLLTATSCPNSAVKCPVPANSNDIRGRLRIQMTF
jgi:Porin subfamily